MDGITGQMSGHFVSIHCSSFRSTIVLNTASFLFSSFSQDNDKFSTNKIVDGELGIQTRDGRRRQIH